MKQNLTADRMKKSRRNRAFFFIALCWTLAPLYAQPSDQAQWQAMNREAARRYGQGNLSGALVSAQGALSFAQEKFGPDHPDTAKSLNNLAVLYVGQGRLAEAEGLYRQGLAIEEKVLGPESADVADTVFNLGRLYSLQGKYSKADEAFMRVLKITEKVYGAQSSRAAAALENLAGLYREMGLMDEAAVFERRRTALNGDLGSRNEN